MASKHIVELKQRLDGLAATPELFDWEPDPPDRMLIDEAVNNFVAGGAELLDQATRYLWAYYRSTLEAFSDAERLRYDIVELDHSVEIWSHVEITGPPTICLGGSALEPAPSYLSFEGEVSWEPEHGLQLVFEHGRSICKVGPFDGHNTNAHAYGDPSLLGVVFT